MAEAGMCWDLGVTGGVIADRDLGVIGDVTADRDLEVTGAGPSRGAGRDQERQVAVTEA
ncbi:hypothetical protein [Streptomyces griseorubiginosus]|uniref:hypothetical protein n=1 Tax=Streptomyces griseorubiginosus TaxID=67304 RepID=UPI003323E816